MKGIVVLNSFLVLLLILLGSFFLIHYDRGARSVYDDRMSKLDTAQQNQMAAIYSYLDHNDVDSSFLTGAERSHMAEVQRIFDVMKGMLVVSIVVLVLELSIIKTRKNKKIRNNLNYYNLLTKSFFYGGVATLAVVLLLALSSLFDFTSVWTAFHHVLFPQGNWQFPVESTLSTLFPEEFFQNFARHLLLAAGTFSLLMVLVAAPMKNSKKLSV